jgi:glucoside 3-dehydrogenase (cytochrome c) hitch-hiker subunit
MNSIGATCEAGMNAETNQDQLINRREAIRRVSALLGGVAFVGGSGLLAAAEKARPAAASTGEFTDQDIAFLDEIAETILPATKTPGAKAAKTGAFMALMVTDCYGPADQKTFRDGMRSVDEATQKAHGVSFMAATPEQRLAVLTVLDHEQKRVMDEREAARRQGGAKQPSHYFRMMKELALLGFFTSEIGCTKVQRYTEVPGRFDPCIPYTQGEPAWASHA